MTPAFRALAVMALVVTTPARSDAQGSGRPARDVSRRADPTDASTAVIRGRVVTADAGVPVRRAEISALSSSIDSRTALTDDNGRFELTELPAGKWYLSVAKIGFLTQPVGARRPFEPAQPVALEAGGQATIDVALTRAGAIVGRVYDEAGEPISGVQMNVLRARMTQQKRSLQPVGAGDVTDDTGAFRIHSLPPGEYYVAGSLRVAPIDSVVQTTHSPTYYPGTGNFAEAQRVVVTPGSEGVVDFPLLPFRTARVSGVVVTSGGSPASAFLSLTSEAGELGVPLGFGGVTREDGTFTLPEVPPGTYTLTATLRSGGGEESEAAFLPVAVYGDDVTGVTLVTSPPGSIRGTVVADTGVTRRLPGDISVLAQSRRTGGDSTFADVNDGEFELTVPPGPFQLLPSVPEGWAVKSITVRDTDATGAPIEIGREQRVPARIVLTDRITEVTGIITGGDPGRSPSVVVFPEDPGKWSFPARFLRAVTTAADGRFRIAGLPPGLRYLAVAVDSLEDGEGEDPDFLSRMKDQAVSFVLAEGEQRVIAIPLLRQ
jgi:hypothetical protein